jgi:hypothetical protein
MPMNGIAPITTATAIIHRRVVIRTRGSRMGGAPSGSLSGSTMNEALHTKEFVPCDRRRSFATIKPLERLQKV